MASINFPTTSMAVSYPSEVSTAVPKQGLKRPLQEQLNQEQPNIDYLKEKEIEPRNPNRSSSDLQDVRIEGAYKKARTYSNKHSSSEVSPESEKEFVPVVQFPSAIEVDVNYGHVNLVRSYRKWTREELDLIVEEGYRVRFRETTWEKVARRLGRSPGNCKIRFERLLEDFSMQSPNFWTEKRQDQLISLFQDHISWDEVAEQIGCHKKYCMDELLKLSKSNPDLIKINKQKKIIRPWSLSDCELLIIFATTNDSLRISAEDAKKLGRSKDSAVAKWRRLMINALAAIKKENFQAESSFWTKEKCVQLLTLCNDPSLSWTQRVEEIGGEQTASSCIRKARELFMKAVLEEDQLEKQKQSNIDSHSNKIKMPNEETQSGSDKHREASEYDIETEEMIRDPIEQASLRTPMNDEARTPEPEKEFAIASGQFPAMMEVDETNSLEELIRGLTEQRSLRTPMNDDTERTPELEKEAEMSPKDIFAAEEFIPNLTEQNSIRSVSVEQVPSVVEVDVTNGHVDLRRLNRKWTQEELNLLFELGCKIKLEGGITWGRDSSTISSVGGFMQTQILFI